MVHPTDISAGVSLLAALLGATLLVFAYSGYRRSRDPRLVYVGAAFAVFAAKSLFVAVALFRQTPGHETLELIDAVGDMTTVLLFVVPLFVQRRARAP